MAQASQVAPPSRRSIESRSGDPRDAISADRSDDRCRGRELGRPAPVRLVRRRGVRAAGPIDTLFDVMIVLSCFVFAIVIVMFGYAIWKFRVKPGDEGDGKPIHGNTKLEIAWTVIPTSSSSSAPATAGSSSTTSRRRPPDAMRLDVTGAAVQVDLRLPGEMIGTGDEATGDDHELHVPVDRQLDVAADGARRPALVLGPGVGDQARRWFPARTRRPRSVDNTVRRHARPGGHLQPRLHRALRDRACDDAGDGRGRVARTSSTSG